MHLGAFFANVDSFTLREEKCFLFYMVDGDIGERVPVIFLYLYSLLIQFLIKLMVVISSK